MGGDDQADLAWHSFQRLFGSADRHEWRLWLAPRRYRQPQLAIAVPEDELKIFTPWLEYRDIRIEPLFTALWDSLNRPPLTSWVIHHEGERCLIARHEKGYLQEIHWRPTGSESNLSQPAEAGKRWDLSALPLPTHLLEGVISDPADREMFRPCLIGVS